VIIKSSKAYSGFSTNDIPAAKAFYADTLGLDVTEENGMLTLHLSGGTTVLIYPKDDHQAATYTVLNFPVTDIEGAVDELTERGVTFERYEGMEQDARGVMRGWGPAIAWFTDPAGNVISVIEESEPAAS
jgi:catechol 2,3-dioxygenase-like lactoylglutathione lyase family enzyme